MSVGDGTHTRQITHVAAGFADTDAVNVAQLKAVEDKVATNTESIYHINNRVSNLDNKVNKVGAGAAALAALHPLDFDPDDKWDFAVGYGNYRNANSVAFGAFYRPNEDTMFSLGTNFGNGENMFNAGLSFKIGQGSGVTTSRTVMAKKIEGLEDTVDKQDKKIAELEALVKEQSKPPVLLVVMIYSLQHRVCRVCRTCDSPFFHLMMRKKYSWDIMPMPLSKAA